MGCSCHRESQVTYDTGILEEVEFIMVRHDRDRDGKLSFEEARPYIVGLNQDVHNYSVADSEREDLVRELFREIDVDLDNYISREELYQHVVRYQQVYKMQLSHKKRPI